jgi:hypothetical protein
MEVRDGVLRYPDGKEVALWGVAYYPQSFTQYFSLERLGVDRRRSTDEDLDDFVEMGIDVIRIHVFDSEISDGDGNLIENDHLDGLDYLVAQCNRKGIYLMLTPIAWWGSPGARPDSFSRNAPMPAMSMWPAMWPIQARYIGQLLTHKNPYTGHRLVDEPSLALFEIINEPWYWSYSQVVSGDVASEDGKVTETTKRGWAGVRDAFHKAVPAQWRNPATFAWFRYDTVRTYIDAMVDAMRSAGAKLSRIRMSSRPLLTAAVTRSRFRRMRVGCTGSRTTATCSGNWRIGGHWTHGSNPRLVSSMSSMPEACSDKPIYIPP